MLSPLTGWYDVIFGCPLKQCIEHLPDDQEVCLRDLVLVDWSSVEIVLKGLDGLAGNHLAQEGASMSLSELAILVFEGWVVAAGFALVVVFQLKFK